MRKIRKSEFMAFVCWVFGNRIWILEGAFTENIYLVVMFGFYWITALSGFYNSGKPDRKMILKRDVSGSKDQGS